MILPVFMALRASLPPVDTPMAWLVTLRALDLRMSRLDVQSFGRMANAAVGHAGQLLRYLVTGITALFDHWPFRVDHVTLDTGCRRRGLHLVTAITGNFTMLPGQIHWRP